MELDFTVLVLHKVRNKYVNFFHFSAFLFSCVLAASNHLSIIYTAYSTSFRLDSGDSADFNNQCEDIHAHDDGDSNTTSTYVYDSSVFTNTVVTEWNLVEKEKIIKEI